jgi:hypothetical protein
MRKIVATIVIGLLLGYQSTVTHVDRPCRPADFPQGVPQDESIAHCVLHEKVYLSPSDLLHNKRDSLVHFSETFVGASLVCFALISLYNMTKAKRKAKASEKLL